MVLLAGSRFHLLKTRDWSENQKLNTLYQKIENIIFLIGIILILVPQLFITTGCAKIAQPTGGPRDTIAPSVVSVYSSKNYQTNFSDQQIQLTFDEWVQLNQPTQEVIVSPPLNKNLKIELKGKTVTIDLSEETLRENATYTFNFGKAIQDYTERNAPEDLRFVFSTGDYIDSLIVEGSVTDEKGSAASDVLVMLYDNLDDTVVQTERPFYFARTNKQGTFRIQNVRSDTFKIFALIDENNNYLNDLETEKIAFIFENVVVDGLDTLVPSVGLQLFQPSPTLRRTTNQTRDYGHLRFGYNQILYDSLDFRVEPELVSDYVEQVEDTLHFWYTDTISTRTFFINDGKNYFDTIDISFPKDDDFYEKNERTILEIPTPRVAKKPIKQNPNKPVELVFRHPFYDIDTSKLLLLEDTLEKRVFPFFSRFDKSRKNLAIDYDWIESTPYRLILLPGAIRDIFGLENDTIRLNYNVDAFENYGNIEVTVSGLSADSSYVVELLDKSDKVVETFTVSEKATIKQAYKALPTGNYKLKLTLDDNQNGRWDTGEYPTRQPERIVIGKAEELRPNWDLELILDIGAATETNE